MKIKEILDTTVGKIVLIVVVVGIWSVNFISFAELSGETEVLAPISQTDIDIANLDVPGNANYAYPRLRRNPFDIPDAVYRQKQEEPEEEIVQVQQEVVLPPLTLNGILDGTAFIKLHSGEEYIVTEGDTFFQDIVVNKVWADSIAVTYQNKKFSIILR